MRIGAAAIDITPPVGTALDGYGGRLDVSLGVHDPLYARALYLDDGITRQMVHLNRPWLGLYVPPMVWASEGNFDSGTVYLVLTSDFYNEADYLRDYDEFLAAAKLGREPGRAQ